MNNFLINVRELWESFSHSEQKTAVTVLGLVAGFCFCIGLIF